MADGPLSGKVAIVTGAGSTIGMGRSITLAFIGAGARVTMLDINEEALDKTANEARELSGDDAVLPIVADVSSPADAAGAVSKTISEFGGLHILVNNAGTNTTNRTVTEMAPEDWDRVVDINLTGAFNCFRGVYPQMKEPGDGIVINIASMAGRQVSLLGGAAYCASKHGMVSLTQSINLEAADSGIRASVILPGEVDTPILAVRPQPVSEKRQSLMLKPEDLGETVVFVANMPPHVSIPEMWIMPTYQVSGTPLP